MLQPTFQQDSEIDSTISIHNLQEKFVKYLQQETRSKLETDGEDVREIG